MQHLLLCIGKKFERKLNKKSVQIRYSICKE